MRDTLGPSQPARERGSNRVLVGFFGASPLTPDCPKRQEEKNGRLGIGRGIVILWY